VFGDEEEEDWKREEFDVRQLRWRRSVRAQIWWRRTTLHPPNFALLIRSDRDRHCIETRQLHHSTSVRFIQLLSDRFPPFLDTWLCSSVVADSMNPCAMRGWLPLKLHFIETPTGRGGRPSGHPKKFMVPDAGHTLDQRPLLRRLGD
jgi:hypothetical protein